LSISPFLYLAGLQERGRLFWWALIFHVSPIFLSLPNGEESYAKYAKFYTAENTETNSILKSNGSNSISKYVLRYED
jgi:hypothetical protein